jgi:hypothetical protein
MHAGPWVIGDCVDCGLHRQDFYLETDATNCFAVFRTRQTGHLGSTGHEGHAQTACIAVSDYSLQSHAFRSGTAASWTLVFTSNRTERMGWQGLLLGEVTFLASSPHKRANVCCRAMHLAISANVTGLHAAC